MSNQTVLSNPVLCRDCKFCAPDKDYAVFRWFHLIPLIGQIAFFVNLIGFREGRWEFAKCMQSVKPNLVSGKQPYRSGKYCSVERDYSCGIEAKFFEARQP